MHVHLIVPDLFGPVVAAETVAGSPAPVTPALETILARGRKSTQPAASFESWWAGQFSAPEQPAPASAPFALAADGGTPGERNWVHADPVHLRVERDHLVLIEPDPPLDRADSEALLATLNERFARQDLHPEDPHPQDPHSTDPHPNELRFVAPLPGRWYAAFGAMPTLDTAPLALVRGHDITTHLPRGEGGRHWQRLMTEVQMVLHEHPVNAAREARRLAPINSVWFSGAGRIVPVHTPPVQLVCCASPMARGLAQAAGVACTDVPTGFEALIAAIPATRGLAWCVLDVLRAPVAYADHARWAAALAALERDWFAPMLAALRARRIGMITLHAFGAYSELLIETTASDLRYLWRRRRPLHAYVDAAALAKA